MCAALLSFRSPLDYIFYLALANNMAAIFGLAGILTSQRELVQIFFGWNAVQMVHPPPPLFGPISVRSIWLPSTLIQESKGRILI